MTEAARVVPEPTKPTKPTNPTQPYRRSGWAVVGCALAVVGAVLFATSCGNGGNSSATRTTANGPGARSTTTTIPPRSGPMTSFGDGTFVVGIGHGDVAPGTYRTRGTPRCYWARLRSGSGPVSDVIVNDNPAGQAIVTIDPTDRAFQSIRCGTWMQVPSSGVPVTSFGDGTWAVGIDIAAGTYHTAGGIGCQWARLSAFGAVATSGVIASDHPQGAATVVIAPTDVGFSTRRCGTWTKTG